MRRLCGRWAAVVALLAGIAVGAVAVPASADTPASSTPAATVSSAPATQHGVRPAIDWWL